VAGLSPKLAAYNYKHLEINKLLTITIFTRYFTAQLIVSIIMGYYLLMIITVHYYVHALLHGIFPL